MGLALGAVAIYPTQLFGPIGAVLFAAAFAFGLVRPRSAAAGGVLLGIGTALLIGELLLVESCNAYNRTPAGRCSHGDVTTKVLFEVAVIALGASLSTYAFAGRPLGKDRSGVQRSNSSSKMATQMATQDSARSDRP